MSALASRACTRQRQFQLRATRPAATPARTAPAPPEIEEGSRRTGASPPRRGARHRYRPARSPARTTRFHREPRGSRSGTPPEFVAWSTSRIVVGSCYVRSSDFQSPVPSGSCRRDARHLAPLPLSREAGDRQFRGQPLHSLRYRHSSQSSDHTPLEGPQTRRDLRLPRSSSSREALSSCLVLARLIRYFEPGSGFTMESASEAPAGAGISGSSALMIATATALNQLTRSQAHSSGKAARDRAECGSPGDSCADWLAGLLSCDVRRRLGH